jgi:hypothetical protein
MPPPQAREKGKKEECYTLYTVKERTDMTHLFIGIGAAGEANLEALLDYRAVRRARPIVLKVTQESAKADKIEERLKSTTGVEVAFVFSGLGNNDLTPRIAEIVAGSNVPVVLVGIVPANRREKRETLINAYHALEQLKEHVNTFLIVDNERIAHLSNFEDYYPSYNRYIASCIADILAGTSAAQGSGTVADSERRFSMPMKEVVKVLSFDDGPGYVALSRASELTKGLWGYILPFLKHKPLDLRTLLRVSLEKFSVSDAPPDCEKSITFLQVPHYYIRSRSVDREQVEEVIRAHTKESHLALSTTKRNIASITNLFTFKFDQLERLREIRRFAHEGV